jgi:hypothetical protein
MLCYHNLRLNLTLISLKNAKNVTQVLNLVGMADVNQRGQLHQVEHLRSQASRSATSQIDTNLTDYSPSDLSERSNGHLNIDDVFGTQTGN